MTLDEIINLARVRLRDRIVPYLWDDDILVEFANAAVVEACFRARLLRSKVALPVVSGVDTITLPYTVLRMEHALYIDSVTGNVAPITNISETDFDWLTINSPYATSQPQSYKMGLPDNIITLYPVPLNAGLITADIRRLPTDAELMVSGGDSPVIPSEFHRDLVWWILHEAYTVHDADLQDLAAADKAEAKFTAKFGYRPTARGEMMGRKSVVGQSMYPQPYGGTSNVTDFHHTGEFFP